MENTVQPSGAISLKEITMILNFVERIRLKAYSAWFRRNNRVVQTGYMDCDILVRANEDVGVQILAGSYEKDDLKYLLSNLRDGDVFFDIGANVGLFSLAVAKKNSTVTIHAFEPIPLNAYLFGASLCLNDVYSVKLNQACVGDRLGQIDFSLAADSAYSSIHDTGRKTEIRKINVPITTLDSYLSGNDLQSIQIMKVDVEGAEKMVLDGAKSALANITEKPRLVLIELFDKNLNVFNTSIVEILEIMKNYGYVAFVIENGRKIEFQEQHYNKIYNVFFEKVAGR